MKLRYELVDSHRPDWRGMRFSTLDRARKAKADAYPPGRWILIDRQTKQEIRDE